MYKSNGGAADSSYSILQLTRVFLGSSKGLHATYLLLQVRLLGCAHNRGSLLGFCPRTASLALLPCSCQAHLADILLQTAA